mgnify:CR=1 FL=1
MILSIDDPGSNRTIVGLKQVLYATFLPCKTQQQSHHCGIETDTLVGFDCSAGRQQSHHCGIETWQVPLRRLTLSGSNRTIVGLKPNVNGGKSFVRRLQQSHHCGIETRLREIVISSSYSQQSHHCGIETVVSVIQRMRRLKQQSHHCGIETC